MAIGPWSYTLSRISTMGAALERLIDKQVCTAASFTEPRIILPRVLNIRANDGDFAVSLDPKAVRFPEMIVPLSGDCSCHTIRRHAVLPPNCKIIVSANFDSPEWRRKLADGFGPLGILR